jgi:hypothetical protein
MGVLQLGTSFLEEISVSRDECTLTVHTSPCLVPTPPDFNNPSASVHLRLTRRPSRSRHCCFFCMVAHERVLPCDGGTRGVWRATLSVAQPVDSVSVLRYARHSIRDIVSRQRLFDTRKGPNRTKPISLRNSLWVSMKIIRLNQPSAHQRLRRGILRSGAV